MYLIRHGATANNLAKPPRLQGCGVDFALSDDGRRQAERTASFLTSQPLAAVFSSPLIRARETAQQIAVPHGLDVQIVDELIEVDVGKWESRSWDEIARTEPDAYRRFMEDPGKHGYFGGETMQQVQDRVMPTIRRIMAAHLGQRVAVVAHNVVNRSFLAALIDLPIAKARGLHQENCGINIVRLRDGEMTLRTMNATFHLDGMNS